MKSPKDIQKAREEREYFELFAQKRGFSLADKNFESRPEPEPDILYSGELETIAFELTNCLEREFQHDLGKRKKETAPSKAFYLDLDHCESVLKNKLENATYRSKHPVELLIFYGRNGQNFAEADDFYAGKLSLVVTDWVASEKLIQFRRIWYFGKDDAYLLFSSLGESTYELDPNSGY
jgi:hypothetical protein